MAKRYLLAKVNEAEFLRATFEVSSSAAKLEYLVTEKCMKIVITSFLYFFLVYSPRIVNKCVYCTIT